MKVKIKGIGRNPSIAEAVGFISFAAERQGEVEFLTALASVYLDGGEIIIKQTGDKPDFRLEHRGMNNLPQKEKTEP
jgi:hypothetical protein